MRRPAKCPCVSGAAPRPGPRFLPAVAPDWRSVFTREALPCRLFRHAQRPTDLGPAESPSSQDWNNLAKLLVRYLRGSRGCLRHDQWVLRSLRRTDKVADHDRDQAGQTKSLVNLIFGGEAPGPLESLALGRRKG